jgi:hypothetical protein
MAVPVLAAFLRRQSASNQTLRHVIQFRVSNANRHRVNSRHAFSCPVVMKNVTFHGRSEAGSDKLAATGLAAARCHRRELKSARL